MSIEPVRLGCEWLDQCLALSDEAQWNQLAADWRVFMTHGVVLGALDGGRLVGTAAALPYGPAFGWLSMVLVTREWRGRGIASRLVAACMALLQAAGRAVLLDATPAGAEVYGKLGFAPLCTMERWQGVGGGVAASGSLADLSPDTAAFGADRGFLLDDVLARPGSAAFTAGAGFTLLRHGARAMQVGPLVAAAVHAPGLALTAIDAASGAVFIDVLEAGYTLRPALAARGFRKQRGFTRMAFGRDRLPGDPSRLLVAAGPEYG